MPVKRFPDPRSADDDGILAIGGDLHPDSLNLAYSQGIFPWPIEGLPLTWFSPAKRAILEFKRLHVPRSLEKARKKALHSEDIRFTIDRDFEGVIQACAGSPRPGQNGTWITPEMEKAYVRFHRLGYAHSVEVWRGTQLIGGLYGVDAGGAFAAESMFYREPNASKLALLELEARLSERGLDWIDIQVMTPHLKALGAREITRDQFLEKLSRTQSLRLKLFGTP